MLPSALTLLFEHHAAGAFPRVLVVRCEHHCPPKIGQGIGEFLFQFVRTAATIVQIGIFRIELDRFAVVGDGAIGVTLVRCTPVARLA